MTYFEAVEYINNIPRFTSKNEPLKTRAFLETIGDFSETIPTIHIAGTNGKGSVSAFLRSAFIENGKTVAMFTSPHLVNITERFYKDNEEMSWEEFADIFNCVLSKLKEFNKREGFENYHPTFFEYLFFMGAVWFLRIKPDVIILETGLGGRLDATNAIRFPSAVIITEIGLDHCEYLGNTKEAIAYEKAGIIKENVPVIYADRIPSVSQVFIEKANSLNASVYGVGAQNIKNCETLEAGIDFSMQSLYDGFVKITLNTMAHYQVENASLAFRAMEVLAEKGIFDLDTEKILTGLKHMQWPGRMERVRENLVIDGAHNEDGINAFLESVKSDRRKVRTLLYSAVADKDVEKVASLIIGSGLFSKIFVAKMSGYRSCDLERLKAAFSNCLYASFYENISSGYEAMKKEAQGDCLMYSAGSLYLVGELKAVLAEEEK